MRYNLLRLFTMEGLRRMLSKVLLVVVAAVVAILQGIVAVVVDVDIIGAMSHATTVIFAKKVSDRSVW